MTENPLHEAHEHLEELDERPASRLKVVITVSILLVTMLTTLAGVMAAIWSAKHAESQRERQQATAESLQASLEATSQEAVVDQGLDDVTEAAWRSAFLDVDSLQVTDRALAATLRSQAVAASQAQTAESQSLPAGADGAGYSARLREPALVDEQRAKADAQQSVGWLGKNNNALAVVGMLALSLFLLGLALTLANRPTQIGFTALSIVMTVIAGARLAQVAAAPIHVASESCIENFGHAVTSAVAGHATQSEAQLASVVGECPHFDAAWSALGQARFQHRDAAGRAAAQQAYQQALNVADAKSSYLYNDLGYLETLNRDFGPAQANLDEALRLSPENPIVRMSRAELAIARGDSASADEYLDETLKSITNLGPYFRNEFFFAGVRSDTRDFASAGLTGPKIDEFFLKTREAEASLDSLGTPTPQSTHGGRITDLVLRRSDTELGKVAGFVTIGFDYSGIKAGDHIAVRFYGNGLTYDLTASLNSVVPADSTLVGSGVEAPDSHFRLALSNAGTTTMEVYLNGVEQGTTSITT